MLKLASLIAVSLLLSWTIVIAVESGHVAEAMKSATKKIHRNHYSYWMGNQVCGDQLCDGPSYEKWHQKYRTHKSPYDAYNHKELLKIKTN